jgi:hypothetical protein
MNILTNLKINLQRWNFRRKQRKAKRIDADKMAKTCIKANLMSKETKIRLWVLKVADGDYRIFNKNQVKGALRSMGLQSLINMYQPNQYIVHITKKPQ